MRIPMRCPLAPARFFFYCACILAAIAATGCSTTIEEYMEDLASKDAEDRLDAAVALGKERAQASSSLLEDRLAKDEWALVRAACGRALARIGKASSVAALVRALEDKEPIVRCEAVAGLGLLGRAEPADKIASLLRKDPAPEVRRECAKALARLEAAEHIPALIDALEDRNAVVSLHAELALRRLTCRDLGKAASDWREWHEEFGKRVGSE